MSAIISPTNIAEQAGVYVFPASSSDGRGKVFYESNVRDISGKITTRNYKSSESDFNVSYASGSSGITVTKGVAMINGYRVVIPSDFNIQLITSQFDFTGNIAKYNINLKIAKQSSTSGYIADTSENSDYGVIYIDYTLDDNSPKTMKQYYEMAQNINSQYKPSEQRLSDISLIDNVGSVGVFQDYDTTYLQQSISENDYTALGWLINRNNSLFVSDLAYKTDKFNVLSFNKSENNYNPSLSLTIGYVVLQKSNGSILIAEAGTYDCTKRVDLDEIFYGDQKLVDYLLENTNCFLKQYGANVVTSVRTPEFNSTGLISKIPYISTVDSLFYGVYKLTDDTYVVSGKTYYTINSETHRYQPVINPESNPHNAGYYENTISNAYMYMPVTYMGETYSEDTDNGNVLSDTDISKSIIECSFNSVPNENSSASVDDRKIYGSKILTVAGSTDCYTSYGYNLIKQEYDGSSFISKICKTNKYFVGIKDISSNLFPIDDNVDKTKPPFGLFNDNASVLIRNIIENSTSKDIIEELASKILLATPTMYNQTNTEYCAFEVDNNDASYNIYKRHEGYVDSGDTEYDSSKTYYVINPVTQQYVEYTGGSAGWDATHTTYYVVGEVTDKLSAGFKTVTENNVNKPAVVFTNGATSSHISLSEETDTEQNTPVIKFSDNVRVNGYVRADRVYNAVYNDYAEWYESSEADKVTAGDLIYYDVEKDEYTNHSKSPKTVVGVCSDNYGVIVGGNEIPNPQDNRKDFIPVSLCGRVPVKVINSRIFECGDCIYADGTKIGTNVGTHKIGKFIKAIDENTALAQIYLG